MRDTTHQRQLWVESRHKQTTAHAGADVRNCNQHTLLVSVGSESGGQIIAGEQRTQDGKESKSDAPAVEATGDNLITVETLISNRCRYRGMFLPH